ncbi:hypothetical protein Moror_15288, partial [Moniliophthora roreri MCA 2997]
IFGQLFAKYASGSSRQAEGSRASTSKNKPRIQLSDSRREAREAALRERGLLPPRSATAPTNRSASEHETNQKAISQTSPSSESTSTSTPPLPPRPTSPALSDVSDTETLFEEPRTAVNPTMYTRESIWREVNDIEDYESRRVTTLAFMG